MIKAVFFDLDGTLLDRDSSLSHFISSQYERFYEHFSHIDKETFMTKFIDLDCNGYLWKDVVYQELIKQFNVENLTIEQLLADYIHMFPEHCIPFPNVKRLLAGLKKKGIKIGIITNGKELFQQKNIDSLQINTFFDSVLISEKEGLRKPDPRIFQKGLTDLNVKAEEALFIGDHIENDVYGAQQVGMLGIWKRNNKEQRSIVSHYIDDLMEVLTYCDESLYV
ncbi:putative hydrolase of the HAD superfamily [Salirhabdus euzebyi]|uniref:Putative hydrolase of the HAD superfamily n=1 Tax=Salirhabdus euzebyi TaxID=394506 RepID=A0A841Q324_9BACI|nr:HAD family hydrolase [Salirhabdus euzebyi]MBB6452318.1 putative hydrolase of the HAD superfamily [Salirhabdus euzebyi]